MDYLSLLDQTVSAALTADRVGTPVFVRWTAVLAATKADLQPQLAAMTALTNGWLAAPLQRIYATGTVQQGHLSLALDYATGPAALLALTLAHDHPHVNLAIYGNQGALYHSDFIVPARDGDLASYPRLGEEAARAALMQAIDASLAAQQPVHLSATGVR